MEVSCPWTWRSFETPREPSGRTQGTAHHKRRQRVGTTILCARIAATLSCAEALRNCVYVSTLCSLTVCWCNERATQCQESCASVWRKLNALCKGRVTVNAGDIHANVFLHSKN